MIMAIIYYFPDYAIICGVYELAKMVENADQRVQRDIFKLLLHSNQS